MADHFILCFQEDCVLLWLQIRICYEMDEIILDGKH